MKYILLCGGIGSRYNNYSLPKPLNFINGRHMIEYTIANIPSDEIYIIYNMFLDEYNFKEIVVNLFKKKTIHFARLEYLTRGAVESAYIGIKQFEFDCNDDDNIVFIDNDNMHTLGTLTSAKFDTHFIGYGIDESEKTNYSFIRIDNDKVIDIAEKHKISNNFCCGLYGFRNATVFESCALNVLQNNDKTNNEFYFSQLYKSILEKDTISPVYIEKTQHIGSYNELVNHLLDIPKPKLRICFDLDNTLVTYPTIVNDYTSVKPIAKNIDLLNMFKGQGHDIIIYTARRMTTHNNNVGKVIKDIALTTINTLEKFDIPYDELIFGKPIADIYIDDRAFNPFVEKISHHGFFMETSDFLPNKIIPNKYNSIQFVENHIIKTGPTKFMRGELFFYQNIPAELSYMFPKLLKSSSGCQDQITIELEYVKGLPLFYLYKHKLVTFKIIDGLFDSLRKIHGFRISDYPNNSQVHNNYFAKIEDRFKNKDDYYFEDAEAVYQEIVSGLERNYSADIVSVIHGDFWFSNIFLMYDDSFKFIDMKGQVDGILTIGGDRYYDYGKMYQSILGYDLVLNGIEPDREYLKIMQDYFILKCVENGLNTEYLKYVTKSLIFGTFHFIDKPVEVKNDVWGLLKSVM